MSEVVKVCVKSEDTIKQLANVFLKRIIEGDHQIGVKYINHPIKFNITAEYGPTK